MRRRAKLRLGIREGEGERERWGWRGKPRVSIQDVCSTAVPLLISGDISSVCIRFDH